MIFQSKALEEQALVEVAAQMCVAARTAPKTKGIDIISTMVLTGVEKDALADKIAELGKKEFKEDAPAWYGRDAISVKKCTAIVLIGAKKFYRGMKFCSYCGFEDCAHCQKAGGNCAFMFIDLGVAACSAATIAASHFVDNRIMMSIGKAAMALKYGGPDMYWLGIPLSASGKDFSFDRVVPTK